MWPLSGVMSHACSRRAAAHRRAHHGYLQETCIISTGRPNSPETGGVPEMILPVVASCGARAGKAMSNAKRRRREPLSYASSAAGQAAPEGSEGQNHLTQSYSRKDRSHVLTSFALEFAARAPLPQMQDRSYRARVHAVSIRGPPCPRTVRSGSRVQTIRSGQR